MRISSLIRSIENGLVVGVKGAGRQARRINHAFSVELAANRIVDGEVATRKLNERPLIEAFEVQARAEELLAKRDSKAMLSTLADMRKHLARRVLDGAGPLEIDQLSTEIQSYTRLAFDQSVSEAVDAG